MQSMLSGGRLVNVAGMDAIPSVARQWINN
jgi:hypothetical protein